MADRTNEIAPSVYSEPCTAPAPEPGKEPHTNCGCKPDCPGCAKLWEERETARAELQREREDRRAAERSWGACAKDLEAAEQRLQEVERERDENQLAHEAEEARLVAATFSARSDRAALLELLREQVTLLIELGYRTDADALEKKAATLASSRGEQET